MAKEEKKEEKKNVIAPVEVKEHKEVKKDPVQEIRLKRGEVLIEIISGKDKGKLFKTSVNTAKKYYSNTEKYQEVKKNI